MKPSKLQKDIFDYMSNGRGNKMIDAGPGAGKTTTITYGCKYLKGKYLNALLVVFNKLNAVAAEKKLKAMECSVQSKTLHSVGFSIVRKRCGNLPQVDDTKYRKIIKELFPTEREWITVLKKLLLFSRVTLTPLDNEPLKKMAINFGIDFEPLEKGFTKLDQAEILQKVEEIGEEILLEDGVVDYSDMIWFPYKWQIKIGNPFHFLMVDEAQDLSPLQRQLIPLITNENSRVLSVGDPRQAINGFAGADHRSFYSLKEFLSADELPLNICYRCSQKIVTLANQYNPGLIWADGAPMGEISEVDYESLATGKVIQPGDFVLSRLTAPLVRLCLALISNRIAATVKGRDIGAGLVNVVRKVSKQYGFRFKKFPFFLEKYCSYLIKKNNEKGNEKAVEEWQDKKQAIDEMFYSFQPKTIKKFCDDIYNLFKNKDGIVTLSTIHRAKGMEADRVFVFRHKLPLHYKGQRDWQKEQERNLEYVAITRAKRELIWVNNYR